MADTYDTIVIPLSFVTFWRSVLLRSLLTKLFYCNDECQCPNGTKFRVAHKKCWRLREGGSGEEDRNDDRVVGEANAVRPWAATATRASWTRRPTRPWRASTFWGSGSSCRRVRTAVWKHVSSRPLLTAIPRRASNDRHHLPSRSILSEIGGDVADT